MKGLKFLALGLACLFVLNCASFELGNLYPKTRRASFLADNPKLPEPYYSAIANGEICIGMNFYMVIAAIGKPYDINRSTGSWGIHDQWVMGAYNSARDARYWYIYFEDGIVVSWQSR